MRADITPGGTFPDYELPDHTSVPRRLSELQEADPLILTLARGHYCPKEHQQHLELAANYPKIAVAYTQIATIATDEHHELQEFRASVGAQWPFLSDPERIVQNDLDIQEYTDPTKPSIVDLWTTRGPSRQSIELPGHQTVEVGHRFKPLPLPLLLLSLKHRRREQLGDPRHPTRVPHRPFRLKQEHHVEALGKQRTAAGRSSHLGSIA